MDRNIIRSMVASGSGWVCRRASDMIYVMAVIPKTTASRERCEMPAMYGVLISIYGGIGGVVSRVGRR